MSQYDFEALRFPKILNFCVLLERDTANCRLRYFQYNQKMSDKVRIRKSLTALAGTDERRSYFYCLKMLGILPPPPKSGFDQWQFFTPPVKKSAEADATVPPTKRYNPKCLHDVLISSHATSCEHHGFYFSFYHRHIMILTEIFLNFAHQVLKGGFEKLERIYPVKLFPDLHAPHNLWKEVFIAYGTFKNLPEYISNHYWNPTDYISDPDLQLPVELTPQRTQLLNPINDLFYAINKCYPHQLHVPRRWYNNESEYDLKQLDPMFEKNAEYYTFEERKFISGELDPRLNAEIFEKDIINQDGACVKKFLYELQDRQNKIVKHRNYLEYHKNNQKNYPLNNIKASETLANYGAASKNTQYITPKEQQRYNLTPDMVEGYNMLVPHYQYGYALFNNTMKEFLEDWTIGVELSHDYEHDLFRLILNDGSFSVTSLLFWPYHSWVDAQIQFKIRRANTPKDEGVSYNYLKKTLNDKFTAFPQDLLSVLKVVFTQLSEHQSMDVMANWKLSGPDEIKEDTAGFYPILEWITPTIRQFPNTQPNLDSISPAFCARDLVLTHTNIRDSFNFNVIYAKYAEYYQNRFYFVEGLKTFNYDYNYQIGSKPENLQTLLDKTASNLPDYLLRMEEIFAANNAPRVQALETVKNFIAKKCVDFDLRQSETLDTVKIFSAGIEVFASYPVNSKNGPNYIYLKLKNIIAEIHNLLTEKELHDLERYIDYGIFVRNLYIFGKENLAEVCPKCQQSKAVFVQVDDDFRVHTPKLWKYIHLTSLNQYLYDSTNPKLKVKSIFDKICLAPNPKFTSYELVSGAEEIAVTVTSDIQDKATKKFLRLDVESFSITQSHIRSVLSKKFNTFNKAFDFYKIFDVDNSNNNIYFDRYVYKILKVEIGVGKLFTQFEVKIPNFQRLLRLNLDIKQEKDSLQVKLRDIDFEIKQLYYQSAYKNK